MAKRVEVDNGDVAYYDTQGLLHRPDDLPAYISADGTKYWYIHGTPGREKKDEGGKGKGKEKEKDQDEDGPENCHLLYRDGTMVWLDSDSRKHREDDRPAVVSPDGYRGWYIHGVPGRTDPCLFHAETQSGEKLWFDAQFRRHRDGDLPAGITTAGDQFWYIHGVPARMNDDDPHVQFANGDKEWRDPALNRHRDGGQPAYITGAGDKYWFFHGVPRRVLDQDPHVLMANGDKFWLNTALQRHRDGDMPAYITAAGDKYWYVHGVPTRTRERAPHVVLANGDQLWINAEGVLHSDEDLPARVSADGSRYWFVNGEPHRRSALDPIAVLASGDRVWHADAEKSEVLDNGDRVWKDAEGRLHRSDDLPACVTASGDQHWYVHGVRRRATYSEPHVVYSTGDRVWMDDMSRLHRDLDLPACVDAAGNKYWYRHGELGIRDNPEDPHVEFANGSKGWLDQERRCHRDNDLPALVAANGTRSWFVHGVPTRRSASDPHCIEGDTGAWVWLDDQERRHRDHDLPAVVALNGDKFWYTHGVLDRGDDKPAVMKANGTAEWWIQGVRCRRFFLPTIESPRPAATNTWLPMVVLRPLSMHKECALCLEANSDMVVVCAAGHGLCKPCLQQFMEHVNVRGSTLRPMCPECRGALLSTIII
jgi:hypothetical protein